MTRAALDLHGIRLAAAAVGGFLRRTAALHVATGEVTCTEGDDPVPIRLRPSCTVAGSGLSKLNP